VWICLCEAITSGTIERAIDEGARSVAEVAEACGAGTVCGRCKHNIVILIKQRQSEESAG
jgi:bacterioferritin-associated ferredoxin